MKKTDKTALIIVLPIILILGVYIYIKENPVDDSSIKGIEGDDPDWLTQDIKDRVLSLVEWHRKHTDYNQQYRKWVADWGEDWRIKTADEYLFLMAIDGMLQAKEIKKEQSDWLENFYGIGYPEIK